MLLFSSLQLALRSPCRPRLSRLILRCVHSETVLLRIGNLRCGGCALKAEKAIRSVGEVEVKSASVSSASKLGLVTVSDKSAMEKVLEALHTAGYPASKMIDESPDKVQPSKLFGLAQVITLLATVSAVHFGHCSHLLPKFLSSNWAVAGVAASGALAVPQTRLILYDGLLSLSKLEPNMNSLVAVATIAGFCMSMIGLSTGLWTPFFHEQVMLLGIIAGGRLLEESLRSQASTSTGDLLSLQPRVAKTVNGEIILAEKIVKGDTFIVAPGDRFPADCVLQSGSTSINAAVVTGESMLREVGKGDTVYSGCLNAGQTAVTCEAIREASKSFLSEVHMMVNMLQASKSPSMRISDAIVGKFCWFIFAASLSTFLFWYCVPFIVNTATVRTFQECFKLAMNVLVVACPCALGLAAPMAVYIAAGVSSRRSILFRNAESLEKLSSITSFAFDKTGTLTTGKYRVAEKLSLQPHTSADQMMAKAALVERYSSHPIGRAILADVNEGSGLHSVSLNKEIENTDAGVQADGVHVGNLERVQDTLNAPDAQWQAYREATKSMESQGRSVVGVAENGNILGVISLEEEPLKDNIVAAIAQLQSRNLGTWVISGDGEDAVQRVARDLGIPRDHTRWRMSPAQKFSALEQVKQGQHLTAAIGDGVNDAPFLQAADVGVCVPGGTALAENNADIVCTVSNLPSAIRISEEVVSTIRWNTRWALGYNAVLIPIAAGVFLPTPLALALTPPMAASAMSMSSIIVVVNSLLLIRRLSSTEPTDRHAKSSM